jgi:hypothetical protein
MALVTRRTASAGGTDPTFTAGSGAFTVVESMLLAAGWTILNTQSATNKVYFSNGEDGLQRIYIRVFTAAAGAELGCNAYQYSDATNIGFNPLNLSSFDRISFPLTSTYQYVGMCNKNAIFIWSYSGSGTSAPCVVFGLLNPPPTIQKQNFFSSSAMAVGTNVIVNTVQNPIAAGYSVEDTIAIVAQEVPVGQLPCFTTRIKALTASSVTLESVPAACASGALMGDEPQPVCLYVNSNPITQGYNFLTQKIYAQPQIINTYLAAPTPVNGWVQNYSSTWPAITNNAAYFSPDKRTGKVLLMNIEIRGDGVSATSTNTFNGNLPFCFGYTGNTPNVRPNFTIGTTKGLVTNVNYIAVNAVPNTPTGTFWMGPFPLAGTPTVTVAPWVHDSTTYFEADVLVEESSAQRGLNVFEQISSPTLLGEILLEGAQNPEAIVLEQEGQKDAGVQPLILGGETLDPAPPPQGPAQKWNKGWN